MKFQMIHENYNVADLAKSEAFYEKALGLKECRRKEAEDGSFIIAYLKNEESDFELELTWMRDMDRPYDLGDCEFHLAFRVDDYEAAYATTKRWAVSALKIRPWESTLFRIQTDTGWRSFRLNRRSV